MSNIKDFIGDKIDKISGHTTGNLSSITVTGGLTDSGKSPSDILSEENINTLYQPDGTNGFVYTDNSGVLHIDGDIIQSGETYETHAEEIYTTKDLIITRENAITSITEGTLSGIQVTNYDGTNDLLFGTDSDGYFKVGKSGELQILATREDNPNDTSIAFWNNTEKRFDTNSNLTWNGSTLAVGGQATVQTNDSRLSDSRTPTSHENSLHSDIDQALLTTSNVRFSSFGVNTNASGTAGEIRATNNITAYYSDERLKTFSGKILNALDKISQLNGYYFTENDIAKEFGFNNNKQQVGLSAQEVEKVLPEVVTEAPFDIAQDENGNEFSKSGEMYKTVWYDKLVPLLIEAIKEQQLQIEELKNGSSK
jgi:hypothetical protein